MLLRPNELLFVASEVSYEQLVLAFAAVTDLPVDDIFVDFDAFVREQKLPVTRRSSRLEQKLAFAEWIVHTSSAAFYDTVLYLLTRVDRWDVSNAVMNELGKVPQVVLDKFRQLPAFLVLPECLASRYTAKELCLMLQTLGDPHTYSCDTMDKAEACQHIVNILKLRVQPDGHTITTTKDTDPQLVLKLRDVFNLGALGLVENVHAQPPQKVTDILLLSFAKLNLVVDAVVRWLKKFVPAPELPALQRELQAAANDYGKALTSFMYFPREAGPRLQYLVDMNQVKHWAAQLDRDRHARDFPLTEYQDMKLPPLEQLEQKLQQTTRPIAFDPQTQRAIKSAADRIRTRRYYQQQEALRSSKALIQLPLEELQSTFSKTVRDRVHNASRHLGRVHKMLAALRDSPWYHERNQQDVAQLRSAVEMLQARRQKIQERVNAVV